MLNSLLNEVSRVATYKAWSWAHSCFSVAALYTLALFTMIYTWQYYFITVQCPFLHKRNSNFSYLDTLNLTQPHRLTTSLVKVILACLTPTPHTWLHAHNHNQLATRDSRRGGIQPALSANRHSISSCTDTKERVSQVRRTQRAISLVWHPHELGQDVPLYGDSLLQMQSYVLRALSLLPRDSPPTEPYQRPRPAQKLRFAVWPWLSHLPPIHNHHDTNCPSFGYEKSGCVFGE